MQSTRPGQISLVLLATWALLLVATGLTGCSKGPPATPSANQAVFDAVKALDPQAVTKLLDQGASVHARDALDNTPLHTAAASGVVTLENAELSRQITVILLERGANVHATNSAGYTPVEMARALGNQPVVDAIEQHGG